MEKKASGEALIIVRGAMPSLPKGCAPRRTGLLARSGGAWGLYAYFRSPARLASVSGAMATCAG